MDTSELRRLAAEVDEEHREAMKTFRERLAHEVFDANDDQRASRRAFLRRLGLGGAAAGAVGAGIVVPALAASAQSSSTTAPGATTTAAATTTTTTTPPRPTAADLEVLAFGQSLELAAVAAYDSAIASGKLDESAAAVARIFRRHHLEHGQAFAGLMGRAHPGTPNASLIAAFGPQVSSAANQKALLTVAFDIENAAAATYLAGIGKLENLNAAALAASVLPIESRHAVVLGQAIGLAPKDFLPALQSTADALDPADYPIQES